MTTDLKLLMQGACAIRGARGVSLFRFARIATVGRMPVMQPPENRSVDWTGVHPDDSPVEPLDGRSFLARLRMLGERARDLTLLRSAWTEQRSHEKRLSRDSERTSRPSR